MRNRVTVLSFLILVTCSRSAGAGEVIYKEVNAGPVPLRAVQERAYLSQPLDRTMNANQVAVSNSVAAGRRVGRPLENGGFENQIGLGAGVTSWLMIDGFGAVASVPGNTSSSFGAMARFRALNQTAHHVNLVMSGGALREHEGVAVAQISAALGHDFGKTNLTFSTVFEKAFAVNRDEADALLSLGTSYAFTENFRAGIEAIGEDVEAFVEEEEAEGGARLIAGPSLVYEMLEKRLNLGINGGFGVAYLPRPTPDGEHRQTEAFVTRARVVYTF